MQEFRPFLDFPHAPEVGFIGSALEQRRVKRPDLLIEVDNQLGFTRNFLTPAQREELRI
jgi:hypothetical protein